MRRHYWACSKFADWLRGTKKPHALGWDEWRQWDSDMKRASPIRFWLAEDGLDKLQDFIYWPADKLDDLRSYVRNRFIDRVHLLPTRLEPGRWFDLDTRLLHASFEALVDFVELEKAAMNFTWGGAKRPWYHKFYMLRWNSHRSPEAGLDYLRWEIALVQDSDWLGPDAHEHEDFGKPTDQSRRASRVMELYNWWKVVRPARPDIWGGNYTYEERTRIEEAHEKEDQVMLHRLVDLRRSLWT